MNTEYNLSAYFLLPLIKLSVTSFGDDNFINSYVTSNQQVVVEVKSKDNVRWEYWEHQNYEVDFDLDDKTTIVFNIPSLYLKDFNNFVEGKYSEFSDISKKVIKANSGLAYKKQVGEEYYVEENGFKVKKRDVSTHRFLLALDKDANLKKFLESQLDVTLAESAELLDKPKQEEFIKL